MLFGALKRGRDENCRLALFMKPILLRNSFANFLRVAAAALTAVLLPPLLARTLPSEVYGTWLLVLQLAAYVSFLDCGIQTAVGRFVASTTEMNDTVKRNAIVSTAQVMTSILAGLACVLLGLATWQLPQLFREIPTVLLPSAQLALLVVGISLALGLPASVQGSIFVGLQRSEYSAAFAILGKVGGAAGVGTVVLLGGNMSQMALALAGVNLLSYLLQYFACRKLVPEIDSGPRWLSWKVAKELFSYCISLLVWTLAMLMVSGLSTSIVGYFDFKSVAAFAIASTLASLIIQVQSAVMNAFVPMIASLDAKGEKQKLRSLLLSSTRFGMVGLLAMGLPLIFGAQPILSIWVGSGYAAQAAPILQVIVAANIVRLAALPFAQMLVGMGQQRLVIFSPIAEGVVCLSVSLALASMYGAIGVAIGTLVGGFVSVGLHLFYNLPRVPDVEVSSGQLLACTLQPVLCVTPLVILNGAVSIFSWLWWQPILISAYICGTICSIALVWCFGLTKREREQFTGLVKRT